MEHTDQTDKMLTPQEAADQLRVSRHAVYAMYREGRLAVVRLGPTTLRIRQSELDRFVAERTTPAGGAA